MIETVVLILFVLVAAIPAIAYFYGVHVWYPRKRDSRHSEDGSDE
ncbi:hypothetical protein [Natrarchaeobius versutus]